MVTTNFHIDAPRLVISHLDSSQDSHCDFLVELYNSEQNLAANKTISAPMADREAARDAIDSNDQIYTSGYGRYLVSLKTPTVSGTSDATDLPFSERVKDYPKIGVVTMKFRKFEGAPLAPDIGYGLLPAFQGKGYATEAGGALIRWFEEQKGQHEFFGFCDPLNEGSKGVLRRMGFEERGVRSLKGFFPDGRLLSGMVFSKGLRKELEAYGV